MSNLDLFLPLLGTTDVRKKISIGDDIIAFLTSPDNLPKCEDMGMFIDGMIPWVSNSNFKVSGNEDINMLHVLTKNWYCRFAKMDWIFWDF